MSWPTSRPMWRVLRPLGRDLRAKPTKAEKTLWDAIRKRKLLGYRFQRQRAFEKYIVDFYCPEAKLVIEVDGPIHDRQQADDANREEYLKRLGLTVLRFRNEDVLERLPEVMDSICRALPRR